MRAERLSTAIHAPLARAKATHQLPMHPSGTSPALAPGPHHLRSSPSSHAPSRSSWRSSHNSSVSSGAGDGGGGALTDLTRGALMGCRALGRAASAYLDCGLFVSRATCNKATGVRVHQH